MSGLEPSSAAGPAPRRLLSLSEQLQGARVFLMGGTGFLGKVWLSMLLHHFPGVEHVYLVVRERRDSRGKLRQSSEQRFWADIASSPTMNPLRELYPGAAFQAFLKAKVTPLHGDVSEPFAGVSAEMRDRLRGQLTVFVNSAGVVDFNPPLDEALNVNAFGMQNLVALCQDLCTEEVKVPFMHTSTCYVAGDRTGEVHELHPLEYPFPRANELDRSHWDPEREIAECVDTIQLVRHRANDAFRQSAFLDQAKKNLSEKKEPTRGSALDEEVDKVKRRFIDKQLVEWGTERAKFWGWHNIYTYTKSIGEQVVCRSGLPFTIVRPAVIESSLVYPSVGWNEGINTSAPLIYMGQMGPTKLPAGEDSVLDIIPVDTVAHGMFASLAELLDGTAKAVYQYGTSDTNPCRVRRLTELVGLSNRKRLLGPNAKGNPVTNWLQTRLEPVTAEADEYFANGPSKYAKQVGSVAGFLRRFAEGPVKPLVTTAADSVDAVARGLSAQAYVADQFAPFMATHNYRFSCAHTRAAWERLVPGERAMMPWNPDSIEWRNYFLDIHVPGLTKHVYPEIEQKLKREAKPLRRHDHLLSLLEEVAEQYDHAPALLEAHEDGFSRISFRELRGRTAAVAVRLAAAGIGKGDRVILSGKNHPDWVICWFGVVRLGAVVVPLDVGLKPDAAIVIQRSAGAKLCLVDEKAKNNFAFALDLPQMSLQEASALGAVGHLPEVALSGADLASILYTSGTTGDPKGVMLAHENFTSELGSLGRLFPLSPEDRILSVLPMHHAFELTCGLLLPLSQGARIYYLDEINADRLSWGLQEGRITCMVGVPALWQVLERRITSQVKERGQLFELAFDTLIDMNRSLGKATGLDAGRLLFGSVHNRFGGNIRVLISGGAALPPDTQKLFVGLGLPLAEGYGLTEASPVLTVAVPKPGAKVGHVGKPIPGVEIRIGHADDKGVGEVFARGPNVMKGYFGNAAATAAVLDGEGWLHTGDMGRIDHDGRLVLMGRQKEVVVTAAGENIYLDDVENRLGPIRRVKEYCLVGLDDPRGGERLGVLAVPDPGEGDHRLDHAAAHEAAMSNLREAIALLPAVQRPAVVHLVDADLPRTPTKKIVRKEVKKVLEKIVAATPTKVKAGEGVAGPVARAIASVAGVELSRVRPELHIVSELGFDSLMWVELASALDGLGHGRLDPHLLSTAETVADVVRLVGAPPVPVVQEAKKGVEAIELPASITEPMKEAMGVVQKAFNGRALGTKVYGRANIPQNRTVIALCNHSSHLDMGLVKFALGDYGANMVALAAKDYFFEGNAWKVAWFKNFTNVAPIDRKAGFRASFKQAVEVIEAGKVALIFPEGTRQTSGLLAEFKPLVGKLSLETGTDILPLHIRGAYDAMPKGAVFPRKRGITIRIGPPLRVADLRRLTLGMSHADAARTVAHLAREAVEALSKGSVLDLRTLESAGAVAKEAPKTIEELAADVFGLLPKRFDPSLVERPVSWYFSLGEKDGPRYGVTVDAERCEVKPGRPAGNVDCVVKCSLEFFSKLVREAYVPGPEEFISGVIKTNDIPLLIEFARVFRLSEVVA